MVLLAACGSSGVGDIFGGGDSGQQQSYDIRGVVDSVDTSGRSILLTNVSGMTSMLSSGGSGSTVRVYFDPNTPVEHQGRTYSPADLERGDEVSIRVDESGNRLMAERVTVLHDVSGGGGSSSYPAYGSSVRGTVRNIDTSRRTIEVDSFNGGRSVIEYETNTPVYYNNQSFRPADLERGDEIDVRVRDLGSGRLLAQDITVTRNVSGGTYGGSTPSSQMSTVRGTVRHVDTSRRTIEIESASWISGFNSGAGSNARTLVVQYDTNTRVDVSGRLHPVEGLERGDVIEVQVRNLGGSSYVAERLFLIRDVRQ